MMEINVSAIPVRYDPPEAYPGKLVRAGFDRPGEDQSEVHLIEWKKLHQIVLARLTNDRSVDRE